MSLAILGGVTARWIGPPWSQKVLESRPRASGRHLPVRQELSRPPFCLALESARADHAAAGEGVNATVT